jgi:quinoprotein dehydrogenase-associated probable ABC transporter substrate-binding protein
MSSLFHKHLSIFSSPTFSCRQNPRQENVGEENITRLLALFLLLLNALSTSCARQSQAGPARKLRVCADPNNLPFSNQRLEGFENKVAELLARELNAEVEYARAPQRRGFIRDTLKAGRCDVVVGAPANFEMAQTSAPYYRSMYVFVYRKDSGLKIASFDDPPLRKLKIGVQMIGDDGANAPPAHALARRGIAQNVRGYTVYGDYAQDSPPARIVDAVVNREIDVAVVWGPLAGYFAKRQAHVPLELVPVSPQIDLPSLPFVYDISLGVRRGENAFKKELEAALEHRRAEVEQILDDYGVPRIGR